VAPAKNQIAALGKTVFGDNIKTNKRLEPEGGGEEAKKRRQKRRKKGTKGGRGHAGLLAKSSPVVKMFGTRPLPVGRVQDLYGPEVRRGKLPQRGPILRFKKQSQKETGKAWVCKKKN